ncbi:MAG TPA: ComEC/Rec2 family competence protein [Actinomycetota bacterium]|nr:ComEC/Rec2 family competence protein [Actinomycetota bacterium]
MVLADRLQPGPFSAVLAGLGGVALLMAAWLRHRRLGEPLEGELLPRLGRFTALLLLTGTLAVGFADLGIRAAVQRDSPLAALDGRVVSVGGIVASDPQPSGRGWSYTLSHPTIDPKQGAARPAAGRLYIRAYGRAPQIQLGDRIELEVKLASLDEDDPYDGRLARRGVVAKARELSEVRRVTPTSNRILRAANAFRDRMLRTAGAALKPDQAALLLGLTIGDESRISEQVQDDFEAAGLSHLTAVSGANVAMVVGGLGLLLAAIRLPRKAVVIAGLIAIAFFAVITRWEPSVLRASVMASVGLAAFLFGRTSTPAHAFLLAFLMLLAFDPMVLWSVGFQLSFAATAGILWLRPPLVHRLGALPKPLAEAVAIGVAAQAAVFPLIALHFGRISVAAIPANLAAFALVAPVTVLGLAGGAAGLVSPQLAWPLLKVSGFLASALQWVGKTFGRSEGAEVAVPRFGIAQMAIAYLALAAIWLLLARRTRWARWPALGGAVLLLASGLAPALGSGTPAGLSITFFDVGEGDAALVESPAGARILIDGGREPELIPAELRRRGFERVDLVVASHLHADHVIGLQAVLRRFDVALAVHPGVRAPLLPTLTAERPMEVASSGEAVQVGDLTVEFLGPTADLREAAAVSLSDPATSEGSALNNASVVLRVNWAGECVLFTGDVEDEAQQELVGSSAGRLDCTVMKAPHHGSGRLVEEFVNAVDPEWVAVSVGTNSYGHPSAKALRLFEGVGAEVLRTDRLGDVVITMDSEGRVNAGR